MDSLKSAATTGLALSACSTIFRPTLPHVFQYQNDNLYSMSLFESKLSFHLQVLIQTISFPMLIGANIYFPLESSFKNVISL